MNLKGREEAYANQQKGDNASSLPQHACTISYFRLDLEESEACQLRLLCKMHLLRHLRAINDHSLTYNGHPLFS